MQNKLLCNLAFGACMTNNRCFMKAHKQDLQRDFARDLLLRGKEPIPDCTMHFLMPFWGLFSVFQGCWVLLALLLLLKVLDSFSCLCCHVHCLISPHLVLEFTFLTENCQKAVVQPAASLSFWHRDNHEPILLFWK